MNEHLAGDVRRTLVRSAIPMLVGMGTIALVLGMDAYFVGRLGAPNLAALGFAVSVVALMTNVWMGAGVGVTAAIARSFGAGDKANVARLVIDSHIVSVAFAIAISIAGWFCEHALFVLLGAEGETVPLIDGYMRVWVSGIVPLAMVMTGTAALRGVGEMRASGMLILLAALLNLIFDPIFLFGAGPIPPLGLKGAALAFVASNGFVALITLRALARRGAFKASPPSASEFRESCRVIFAVSIPSMITYALVPIGATLTTKIVSVYGPDAVGVVGVVSRLQSLVLIVPLAVASAIGPFVGMQLGARNVPRMHEGVRFAGRLALGWGVAAFVLFALFAKSLGRVFVHDTSTLHAFALCARIVALTFAPAGFVIVIGSAFNAADRPIRATLLMFLRGIGAAIPLALTGQWLLGYSGVFYGLALANGITATLAAIWLRQTSWRDRAAFIASRPSPT